MIYRVFLKRKVTKIYLWIFISFSILFFFLLIAKECIIAKGNEAYSKSFIYFITEKEIDLSNEQNVKSYNKALYANCYSDLTEVFIVDNTPIIRNDSGERVKCTIGKYTIQYTIMSEFNIVQNNSLYDFLNNNVKEYYYFISLENWFDAEKTSNFIKNSYKVEPIVYEVNIDSNNYKNFIYIFNIIIRILLFLFILLFLISIVNVIIDEKKNNKLYYSLGYNRIRIFSITFNKVLLLIFIPTIIFFLLLTIMMIVL
ncbi:MAG: hypothetical protein ACI4XM_06705 [Candidatus Coprovivens sp.]